MACPLRSQLSCHFAQLAKEDTKVVERAWRRLACQYKQHSNQHERARYTCTRVFTQARSLQRWVQTPHTVARLSCNLLEAFATEKPIPGNFFVLNYWIYRKDFNVLEEGIKILDRFVRFTNKIMKISALQVNVTILLKFMHSNLWTFFKMLIWIPWLHSNVSC